MTRARLRAVPDTPRPGIGIIRVSKVGDRGGDLISPDLQRTAIEDYAARTGIDVIDWLEVLDESASQRRSPWWRKLDAAIERVEAGEVEALVGWKFNRAARNRARWAVAIDRIETAGGTLESATEGVDTTTSTGRFTRGVLGEVAAWQGEVIGEGWKEAHAHRVAAGRPHTGKPRWGYTYTDGLHRPDPDTGPVLASLYDRYLAGESFYMLADWLNRAGHRTSPGYRRDGPGLWRQGALRTTMDSGFAAGLIRVHGQLLPGAHDPLIDEHTWTAYQAARATRRARPAAERSQYLLSGLCWCSCGARMSCGRHGGRVGHPGKPFLRCVEVTHRRAHRGGFILMRYAEDAVTGWLVGLRDDVQASTRATLASQARATRRRRDAETITRKITQLDGQLTRLLLADARGTIPEHVFAAARDEITAERDGLVEQARQAEADAGPRRPPRELVVGLLDEWDELSVEHRRGMLRQLIGRVTVTSGRPHRIDITPAWEMPAP